MAPTHRQSGSGSKSTSKSGNGRNRETEPILYAAAVRYRDGKKDFFHVKNAESIADARSIVMDNLMNIRTLLISPRSNRATTIE